jgi:multiple sugar transport system permease protein
VTMLTEGRVRMAARISVWPRLSRRVELGLMLAPYLAGLGLLTFLPLALTAAIAPTDYDALTPPRWTGGENFLRMLGDADFWNGLRASLVLVALLVPLRALGAFGLALLLRRPGRGIGSARAAVYVPTMVPDVAYALVWLYIFNPLFGPLNGLLGIAVGVEAAITGQPRAEGSVGWLLMQTPAQIAVVVMLFWTLGEGFVLMLAALQAIPSELDESAEVDGASCWQRLWSITVPLVAPYLLLVTIRDTVWALQASFTAAVVVTRGGPYYATSYLPYWIYLNAVEYQRFGYAAAMTLALMVVTGAVLVFQFGLARRLRLNLAE